jgi:hypothetical protein
VNNHCQAGSHPQPQAKCVCNVLEMKKPRPRRDAVVCATASFSTSGFERRYLVEVVGRYSKIPKPSKLCHFNTVRPVPVAAPRIHAIQRRLSRETLEQLLGDYQAGISAKHLVKRYQLSRNSLRTVLRESGLPQRYQAMTTAEIEQSVELYATGLTIAQVATKLERPWSTVQTALNRRGIVRRRRHDY